MGIKGISLSDLDEHKSGPLWAINTAIQSQYALPGQIMVSVPSLNGGKADVVTFPQTWLPRDIAQLIPRERLLQSTEFRSAVLKGLLTVISRDDAEKLLRQDGAFEEEQRLRNIEQQVRKQGAARTILDSKVEITRTDGVTDEEDDDSEVKFFGEGQEIDNLGKAALGAIEKDENGLMPSFVMFANKLELETDIAALNAIRARGKFSTRELKFLAKTLRKHPKTVAQITARIEKRKEKRAA